MQAWQVLDFRSVLPDQRFMGLVYCKNSFRFNPSELSMGGMLLRAHVLSMRAAVLVPLEPLPEARVADEAHVSEA